MKSVFTLQNPWRFKQDFKFNYKERSIFKILSENLHNKKILGLVGSRQVGKSVLMYLLIKDLINKKTNLENIFYFNLDDLMLHKLFENPANLIEFVGKDDSIKYIFIDEIQRLVNPGLFLKELYDLNLNIKIIYSGSSQLEIKSKLKEHLVGRLRQFEIQRLSFEEYIAFRKPILKENALQDYIIFGSYPELALCTRNNERKLALNDIYKTYIEKDISEFLKIDNITAFNKLLILLSAQIGSLLNINNLADTLKISRTEIEKYISVLEGTFIIKIIYPFYNNYSKELSKMPKIYFLDLGLRNLILSNFMDLDLRNDTGHLFENFYLIQLLNEDYYGFKKVNFWRTTNQTEVDFIIKDENIFEAVEVKWNSNVKPKSFETLKKYYPNIQTRLVSKINFLQQQ